MKGGECNLATRPLKSATCNQEVMKIGKGDAMLKRLVLLFVVLSALFVNVGPAFAQSRATLYVDTAYVGPEDGSQARPYNTTSEAIAVGQTLPYGADIYVKQADGTWRYYTTVVPVYPGQTGNTLATPVLFALLAALSLALVLGGWFLLRRSRSQA
jgi:hypothetical protein